MNRIRRIVGLGALLAVWTVLAGPALPASAHNSLDSTFPTDKAVLDALPSAVVLTFNEPAIALGTQVAITGPSGPVQQGDPQLVDNTVRQALAPGAPVGDYTVVWRVTSADGHPISGTLTFTAAAAATASATASPAGSLIPAPAANSADRSPGIPGWLWIAVGVVVVVFARPLAARLGGLGAPRDWFSRRRDRP